MARQFEWELSNTHISYPFEANVEPEDMKAVFADALIMDGSDVDKRIFMNLFTYDPGAETASIDLRYDDYSTFFVGATADVYTYGQWIVVRFISEDERKEVVILLNADEIDGLYSVYPMNAVFVSRVTDRPADRVRSITVKDGVTETTHILTGDVEFVAGYNVQLETLGTMDISNGRTASVVNVSAVSGTGMGLVPSECAPDDVLRTLNGVGPDEGGNVSFTPTGCYRYVFDKTMYTDTEITITGNQITMYNDCYPCCECEDYSRVYKGMTRLYNRGRNTGLRFARMIGTTGAPPEFPGTDYKGLRAEMEYERQQRRLRAMDIFLRPSAGYIMGVEFVFKNNIPGEPLAMDLDIEMTVFKPEGDTTDFDPKLGLIIPESVYVFNSSRGFPWERRRIDQVFPEYSDLTDPNQPVLLNVTRTNDEGEEEPEVILGTEYMAVFFEIYFPDDASPEHEAGVEIMLETPFFKPYELSKTEEILEPFDGVETDE